MNSGRTCLRLFAQCSTVRTAILILVVHLKMISLPHEIKVLMPAKKYLAILLTIFVILKARDVCCKAVDKSFITG